MTTRFEFVHNERLGIEVPVQHHDWQDYERAEQEAMITRWETIRARIPDRIKELEAEIEQFQIAAASEDDWDRVCNLYEQLYDVASIINDLNIWYKNEPQMASPDDLSEYFAEVGISEEHTNREK